MSKLRYCLYVELMNYEQTTMVSNSIIDSHLKTLSEKELKVLLVIIRQTIGWVDTNGLRKERDYISHRYFMNKTGLSSKSVTNGITLLLNKNLIAIENKQGTRLYTTKHRRGKFRKFYRYLTPEAGISVKSTPSYRENLRTTKLTPTKLSRGLGTKNTSLQRLSDYERYVQIIRSRTG